MRLPSSDDASDTEVEGTLHRSGLVLQKIRPESSS